LAQAGVNVLTFNYRGTFESEGFFSFSNVIADIGAAIAYLQTVGEIGPCRIDPQNIILGGWSFGGAHTPAGAAQIPGVNKFFTISGRNFGIEARKIENDPVYAEQVRANLEGLRYPQGPVKIQGDPLANLLAHQDLLDYVRLAPQLKDRDILLIAGWDDESVPIEAHQIPFYRALVQSGAQKVRIEAVQDGHEFNHSKELITKLVLDWLNEE
jgi:dipeptidyl aminopeptidase/acylaminoacyl peptidase